MAEGDCSHQKIEEVRRKHRQEKCALNPFGPLKIPEEGLSVCPDEGEVEQRQGDIKYGDENGFFSFPKSQFLSEFRHLLC